MLLTGDFILISFYFSEMQPQLVYVTHTPHEPLGVPFVAPMRHPMVFPAPDPQLHTKIINQIDYYFRYSFSYLLVIIRSVITIFPFTSFETLTAVALHTRLLQ